MRHCVRKMRRDIPIDTTRRPAEWDVASKSCDAASEEVLLLYILLTPSSYTRLLTPFPIRVGIFVSVVVSLDHTICLVVVVCRSHFSNPLAHQMKLRHQH
jgi:hypothetical protein